MNKHQRALLDAGLAYRAAGLSLVPIDGATKQPHWRLLPQACAWPREKDEHGNPSSRVKGIWQTFIHAHATEDEVRGWVDAGAQLGLVGGGVSGGLLIIDFDEVRFYEAWRDAVGTLAASLPLQRTGGGGYQVLLRCTDLAFWSTDGRRERGNEKLAWMPDDSKADGRAIAIETRAARGYAVIAPSLHPSGNQYQMLSGDVTAMPVISRAHATALLDAAIALDEAPFTRDQIAKAATATVKTDRYRAQLNGQAGVIDLFNERIELVDELRRAGYVRRGARLYLPGNGDPLRPGVVLLDEDRKSFHHDSEDPLSDGHSHTAFDVLCAFDHRGDCRAAVKAAADRLGLKRETAEPTFDTRGFACCPTCGKRLRQSRNGNGWRCMHNGELGFWWQGEGYTPPDAPTVEPVAVRPAAARIDVRTGEIDDGFTLPDDVHDRPTIETLDMDIPQIAGEAWRAVRALNTRGRYPALFRRGANLCRVEEGEEGAALVIVEKKRLRGVLARACLFQQTRRGKKGDTITVVVPPETVVDDMLVNVDPHLPPINRVVYAPCLAPDGSLLTSAGYHNAARVFYDPRQGVVIPPVSEQPTEDGMLRARTLILDDLLGDFLFVEDADRAHAVALLLLPFVRELVSGPTPLHLIEAPTMGSGKGLLTDVLVTASTGVTPIPMSAPAEEAEWGKKITSALLAGPSTIFIDNLNHTLDSGTLAAALTTTEWTDRILGLSEMARMPVRCVWVATANNPMLSTEIARRCIRIRIDPKIDKPWERDGFKHPNLRQWMRQHQGDLIWAAITLARYGLAHGVDGRALGSYEGWSAVMGRILSGVGISGFLDNLDALYERADVQSAAWRALVEAWWNEYQEHEVQAADLFTLIERNDIDLSLRGKSERALKTAFGMALGKMQDRVLTLHDPNPAAGNIQLRIETTGTASRLKLWRLTRVNQTGVRPSVPSVPSVPSPSNLRTDTHARALARAVSEGTRGTEGTEGAPNIWASVPTSRLAQLQGQLRSINPSQQRAAQDACARYGIDYAAARAAVTEEPL